MNKPSNYQFRVDSESPFSNARPQSFCHTLAQVERIKLEHQAHLPGCTTRVTNLRLQWFNTGVGTVVNAGE